MFYTYTELHTSQTGALNSPLLAQFYTYTELHTSQTEVNDIPHFAWFYTYTELHTSQTSNEVVYKFYPYGIGFRIDTNTIFLGN